MAALKPNPFEITYRPFAVEPVTGIMLPDGIFDCTIGRLDIKCYIKNTSDKRFDKIEYGLETYTPMDFDIVGVKRGEIRDFLPGANVLVYFEADFSRSSAGIKELMIWISGDGVEYQNKNHLKKIFVTKTYYDKLKNVYVCEADAGILEQSFKELALSKPGEVFNTDYKGNPPQIFIPLSVQTSLYPSNPFTEVYECLPYKDPLWKILAWLIAALAAIGAGIAALTGRGTASIGIVTTINPTGGGFKVCDPYVNKKDGITLANALSVVSSAATMIGLMHYKDPWIIGRESNPLNLGEHIVQEDVSFDLTPGFPIIPGQPYKVKAEWIYKAKTDQGRELNTSKTQEGYNQDIAQKVEIQAPETITGLHPIVLGLKVFKSLAPETLYQANELYAYCLLVSPSPLQKEFKIVLQDNGNKYDDKENDGWFKGGIDLEALVKEMTKEQMRGEWTAYFFAQIVNASPIGATVQESTGYIGGNFVVHPMSIVDSGDKQCPWQDFLRKINVIIP